MFLNDKIYFLVLFNFKFFITKLIIIKNIMTKLNWILKSHKCKIFVEYVKNRFIII